MGNIMVSQEIELFEVNDEAKTDKSMGVCSHWNVSEWVVLKIGRQKYTVDGDSLRIAIDNAMNTD